MSVPLDRLYHYLADVVNHDLVIYRWTPHGSRKLEDLGPLYTHTAVQNITNPTMICHDQEPLFWEFYTRDDIKNQIRKNCLFSDSGPRQEGYNLDWMTDARVFEYITDQHLRSLTTCINQFDLTLLLHSEQNSNQVDTFALNGFVPVYYWSHAIIAQNWFRYAEHDPTLILDPSKIQKDFLIYNRAWSGTREYRLYFTEQLVNQQLLDNTQICFNPVDNQHYTQHVFKNKSLQIANFALEQHLQPTFADATASADYVSKDYADTGIEVVLETLFDDTRWHLTEKTLRPIACGKPFILAATPGSLQYLRNYGFETFAELIDESYDTITNSRDRLDAVVQEMKRIAALAPDAKQVLYTKLHEIAQRNKQHFFNGLSDQVIAEYKTNLDQAMGIMQQHCTGQHRAAIRQLLQQN
jgi:hypothetical protein